MTDISLTATEKDNSEVNEPEEVIKTDEEIIAWLATLSPIEYDRERGKQAKALGILKNTLDTLVDESRVKVKRENITPDNSMFVDIEPWSEPINPAQLLDDVAKTIQKFIVLDNHQAQAAALWVSACWFVDVINCAPICLINAPERACGKTQLLTVMAKLAPRPIQASSITPSVLFRVIEAFQPTLFIDEIETVLKENEELRGLINAGHTRDSASVLRSVPKGDDWEPVAFNVWGMKAIAGINAIKLAETVTSRSIVFELRRKKPNENVERLRYAEPKLFSMLAAKLARFAADFREKIRDSRPYLPDALGDREQDNWEPLLQVASAAGGHWLNTALNVAIRLSDAMQAPMSSANELLADIQEIFEAKQVIKISTSDLIRALCEDEEKSWTTYNRGRELSPRQLSSKLKDYGIASKDLRFPHNVVKKGYEVSQFNDAFTRYLILPLENSLLSATALPVTSNADISVADIKNAVTVDNTSATQESAQNIAGSVVADKIPISGENTQVNNSEAQTGEFWL